MRRRTPAASTRLRSDRDFALYWLGNSVSFFGNTISLVALPLLALYELDASETEVGLLRAAGYAPFLLLSLPIGVLVDRVRRRRSMLLADLARAVLISLVPLGVYLGMLSVPNLIVVVFAAGCVSVVYDLSYFSALPALVGRTRVDGANVALEISHSFAGVAGPAVGGALVAALGAATAVLVDGATFAIGALALAAIRARDPVPETTMPRRTNWREMIDGVTQVRRSGYVLPMAVYLGVNNIAGQGFQTAVIIFLVTTLELSSAHVGLAFASLSAGVVMGATVSRRLASRVGIGPVLSLGSAIGGVGLLLASLAPSGPLAILVVSGGLVLSGCGVGLFNPQNISLRQAVTPDVVLGRVNSVVKLVSLSGMAIGAAAGGVATEVLAPRTVLLCAGALSVLATAVPLLTPLGRTRALPEQDPVWANRA